jgi:hypothetical protein
MNPGQRITFLAGTIYLIGAFLPWVVYTTPEGTSSSQNALSLPNGIFILSIGGLIMITGLAYRGRPGRRYALPIVILSAATAFLLAMIAIRLNQAAAASAAQVSVSLGPGLLLAFASTLIALVGGAYPVPIAPPQKKA